jgi:hypothetical protein
MPYPEAARTADEGAVMTKVINCECGHVVHGETDDEMVEKTTQHVEERHPELAGQMSRDQILSMIEEE